MNAPLPPDEAQRLQTLVSYQILDTPPEVAFERITSMAARLFDAPISLISLIDADRQWFKSCFGLHLQQTDRNISFCAHAILADEAMVVPDATLDPRFRDNLVVTGEPRVRSYVGAPLKMPNGQNLGTLCVIDTVPRRFSAEQLELLTDLAGVVSDAMELRRVARELRNSEAALRIILSRTNQLRVAITNLASSTS